MVRTFNTLETWFSIIRVHECTCHECDECNRRYHQIPRSVVQHVPDLLESPTALRKAVHVC